MRNLKHINEFFKILENENKTSFKNEKELRKQLLENKDFAKGEIHQALLDVFHEHWQKVNVKYESILLWINKEYGILAAFAMQLAKYNYQVGNGGHIQYFDNGYASTTENNRNYGFKNINLHDEFVNLFKELNMDTILPHGKEAYNIISNFELEFYEPEEDCYFCHGNGDIECYTCNGEGKVDCEECYGSGENGDEPCSNCDGEGSIECEDCEGKGNMECEDCDGKGYTVEEEKPYTEEWGKLDDEWYNVEQYIIEGFENYLHTLTLDGETMSNLITFAEQMQKYNL